MSLKRLVEAWNGFWFTPPSFKSLAIFRIGVGGISLASLLLNLSTYSLRYSADGFLSPEVVARIKTIQPYGLLPYAPSWLPYVYGIMIVFSLFLALGIFARLSAVVCFLSHIFLMQLSPVYPQGQETIIGFWFLTLILSDSCRYFSVLPSNPRPSGWARINGDLSGVGVRLVQIQICIIYFFAATSKLSFPSWHTGEALWLLFQNHQQVSSAWNFLLNYPLLLACGTFSTILFELYFPLLVWFKPLRKYCLLLGLVFHGLIAVILRIPLFSLSVLVAYVFFMDWQGLPRWVSARLGAKAAAS